MINIDRLNRFIELKCVDYGWIKRAYILCCHDGATNCSFGSSSLAVMVLRGWLSMNIRKGEKDLTPVLAPARLFSAD